MIRALAVMALFISIGSRSRAADEKSRADHRAEPPAFSYACESAKGKGHLIYRGDVIEWESENKIGMHVLNPHLGECVEPALANQVQNYVIWGAQKQTLVLLIDNDVREGAAKIVARQILDNRGKCGNKIEFRCQREASVPEPAPRETIPEAETKPVK